MTSFDGEPVIESYRRRWLTANTAPGKRVKLGIWRAGKSLDLPVVLQEKPGASWEPPRSASSLRRDLEPFGFAVDEPPRDDGDHGRGLRVITVDLRGPAYRAGLRQGDLLLEVDGRIVPDKSAYLKVISGVTKISRLYVRRGTKALFFGIRR